MAMAMRVKNVAAGFYNATGFHPIRSSSDYDPDRAGDDYSQRKPAAKRKKKPSGRKPARPKAKAHRKRTAKVSRKRNPTRLPLHDYEVVVGNIGTVYSGRNGFEANKKYSTYMKQSKDGYGRAGGEDVTLLKDGEISKEHFGTVENPKRNPIPIKWATAKVRKVGNDIQVMLFPKGKVAKRRVVKRHTVRRKR
jgi:hypothetical protein